MLEEIYIKSCFSRQGESARQHKCTEMNNSCDSPFTADMESTPTPLMVFLTLSAVINA